MSKEMVNALKTRVEKLRYPDLKAAAITPDGWEEINSGGVTYKDLEREQNLTINGQEIDNDFIQYLYSKYKSLITRDENGKKNYRPFLREVFTEMFKHVNATVPNNSIIEELITSYNQNGYVGFFKYNYGLAFQSFNLLICPPTTH